MYTGSGKLIKIPDNLVSPSQAHHQYFYDKANVSKFAERSTEREPLPPEQRRLEQQFQERYAQAPENRRKWRKERRKGLKESIKKRLAQYANMDRSPEDGPLLEPSDFGPAASRALAEQSLSMSQSSGSSSSSEDGNGAGQVSQQSKKENLTMSTFIKKLQRKVGDLAERDQRDPIDSVNTTAVIEQSAQYMRKLQEQIRQHLLVPTPGFHETNADATEHMIELNDSLAPQEVEVYGRGDAEDDFPRLFKIQGCQYNKVYILQLRSLVSKTGDEDARPTTQDVEACIRFPYQPQIFVRVDDINAHATRIQQIKFVPSPPKVAVGEPIDPELQEFNLFGSLRSFTGCRLMVHLICPEKERARAREALAKRLRLESHLARKGNTKRDTAAILKMTREEVLAAEADLFQWLRSEN